MRALSGTIRIVLVLVLLALLVGLALFAWYSGLIPTIWETVVAIFNEPLATNGVLKALIGALIGGVMVLAVVLVITDL
ncbi:hypothetical protein [Kocuria palustris]|uniref:hypothetical protein n=1 Tax=Kocuria palustris TaxID=71999 RepID=UPI002430D3D4|nr:hypothetical protein [Kocuria palustris]